MHVHLLQHERQLEDDAFETKIIGMYSSKAKALEAIERIKTQQGFSDFPDDFSLGKFEMDRDYWVEGFFIGIDD